MAFGTAARAATMACAALVLLLAALSRRRTRRRRALKAPPEPQALLETSATTAPERACPKPAHSASESVTSGAPRRLELLIHNISHGDMVLALGLSPKATLRERSGTGSDLSSSADGGSAALARPKFSLFHPVSRTILARISELKAAGRGPWAAEFPVYGRETGLPDYPICSGRSDRCLPVGFDLSGVGAAIAVSDLSGFKVRSRDAHKLNHLQAAGLPFGAVLSPRPNLQAGALPAGGPAGTSRKFWPGQQMRAQTQTETQTTLPLFASAANGGYCGGSSSSGGGGGSGATACGSCNHCGSGESEGESVKAAAAAVAVSGRENLSFSDEFARAETPPRLICSQRGSFVHTRNVSLDNGQSVPNGEANAEMFALAGSNGCREPAAATEAAAAAAKAGVPCAPCCNCNATAAATAATAAGSRGASFVPCCNCNATAGAAAYITGAFFPLLAVLMAKWKAGLQEEEGGECEKVIYLVSGVGVPRNRTHRVDDNSTEATSRLMEEFLARHYPEVRVERLHSKTNLFRYDDNIKFVQRELLPKINAERKRAVEGWGEKWRDMLHVTVSFAGGSPARISSINAALRHYHPSYMHHWELKTFWHEAKVCDDDIEMHTFEDIGTIPPVPTSEVDSLAALAVQEMLRLRDDFDDIVRDRLAAAAAAAAAGIGGGGGLNGLLEEGDDLSSFWLRKTRKPVLAVLVVQRPGKAPRVYRGTNMEVSMPTGSLCAERNVIGSALADDLRLRRQDLRVVAVMGMSLPQDSDLTNPAKYNNNNNSSSSISVNTNNANSSNNNSNNLFDVSTANHSNMPNSAAAAAGASSAASLAEENALLPHNVCSSSKRGAMAAVAWPSPAVTPVKARPTPPLSLLSSRFADTPPTKGSVVSQAETRENAAAAGAAAAAPQERALSSGVAATPPTKGSVVSQAETRENAAAAGTAAAAAQGEALSSRFDTTPTTTAARTSQADVTENAAAAMAAAPQETKAHSSGGGGGGAFLRAASAGELAAATAAEHFDSADLSDPRAPPPLDLFPRLQQLQQPAPAGEASGGDAAACIGDDNNGASSCSSCATRSGNLLPPPAAVLRPTAAAGDKGEAAAGAKEAAGAAAEAAMAGDLRSCCEGRSGSSCGSSGNDQQIHRQMLPPPPRRERSDSCFDGAVPVPAHKGASLDAADSASGAAATKQQFCGSCSSSSGGGGATGRTAEQQQQHLTQQRQQEEVAQQQQQQQQTQQQQHLTRQRQRSSSMGASPGGGAASRARMVRSLSGRDGSARVVSRVRVDAARDPNPLRPCGACMEWLRKIDEVNPDFRVLTFTDAGAGGVYLESVAQIG